MLHCFLSYFIFGSLFFSSFNISFQIAVNSNLEPTLWYKVVAVSYKKRLAVTRVGARCNICFLCGHWSPGESCFIYLKYCALALCLTIKAPATYTATLWLLNQQVPVTFLWLSLLVTLFLKKWSTTRSNSDHFGH